MLKKVKPIHGIIFLSFGLITSILLFIFSPHSSIVASIQKTNPDSPAIQMPLAQLSGPLSGIRIALSPGHGNFKDQDMWLWQRSEFWGIREDLVNAEIVMYLGKYLSQQGATVIYLREPKKDGSFGASGFPRWQESSRHYLNYLGLPANVWDDPDCDGHRMPELCKDWRARTSGAHFFGADLLISIHNNGGGGTGTETFYDVTGEYHDPFLAADFANKTHNRILDQIWTNYNSDWKDRGVAAKAGDYSEIRFAKMPAILIEAAFMDTQWPDNQSLQDEKFKKLVAKGISLGICDYYRVSCEPESAVSYTSQVSTISQSQAGLEIVLNQPEFSPFNDGNVCNSAWYQYVNDRGFITHLTLNRQAGGPTPPITNHATWRPQIDQAGLYKVEAFIPAHGEVYWSCPTLTLDRDSSSARYSIHHANGQETLIRDQYPFNNEWLDLGTYYFNPGSEGHVSLSDETNEINYSTTVSFSGMRFTLLSEENQLQANQDIPSNNLTNYLPTEERPQNIESESIAEVPADTSEVIAETNNQVVEEVVNPSEITEQPIIEETSDASEITVETTEQQTEESPVLSDTTETAEQPVEESQVPVANENEAPISEEVVQSNEQVAPDLLALAGDVTCDNQLEAIDGFFILQYDVGLRTASEQCPPAQEALFTAHCEVNGDGYCDAVDALLILQCQDGISNSLCPTEGSIFTENIIRESATVSVDMMQIPVEGTVIVPVNIALPADVSVGAAKVIMTYNPNIVIVEQCLINETAKGQCNTQTNGVIELNMVSTTGGNGTFTLANITFRAIGAVDYNTPLDLGVQGVADITGSLIPINEVDGQLVIVP